MQIVIGAAFVALVVFYLFLSFVITKSTLHWFVTIGFIVKREVIAVGEGGVEYTYLVNYNIDGKNYESKAKYISEYFNNYGAGESVNILYNPKKHDEIALIDRNELLYKLFSYLIDAFSVKSNA